MRSELIPLIASDTLYGGESKYYEFFCELLPSEASITLLIINSIYELFTYREKTSYGYEHLRVLADRRKTFYIEEIKGLSNNDLNDLIAKITVIH